MDVVPAIHIDRFEKLKPGDLFIYTDRNVRCAALKGVAPTAGDEAISLLLGPEIPEGMGPGPWVTGIRPGTVISFGANYLLRLPTDPEGWMSAFPPDAVPCVLIADGLVHFRGSFGRMPGESRPCWLEAVTGTLQYDHPRGLSVYAVKWEIVIPGIGPPVSEQVVFRAK